jgi:hypothetical protein
VVADLAALEVVPAAAVPVVRVGVAELVPAATSRLGAGTKMGAVVATEAAVVWEGREVQVAAVRMAVTGAAVAEHLRFW